MIRRLLPPSGFARGVSVLVSGTAGAQLLLVLSAPLLTRLYSPDDFGMLAVYGGLVSLIAVVGTLRYELAVPLPRTDSGAAQIVGLGLILVFVTGVTAAVAIFFLAVPFATLLGIADLAPFLWLVPVGVVFLGVYQLLSSWAVRAKKFSRLAGARLAQAIASLATQLAGFSFGVLALIVGQAAGHATAGAALAAGTQIWPKLRTVHWRGICWAAKRFRRFPIYSTWSALLNSAGRELPPLIIAGMFGVAAAGVYALANRVLALPMAIVGQAVAQVFFSHGAERHREGTLPALFVRVQKLLFRIALAPALLVMILGPMLFGVIFGEDWKQAGEVARWLAPWLFLVFIGSPLSQVVFILGRQRSELIFQVTLATARISALVIGGVYSDFTTTVMAFGMVSACLWLCFLIWLNLAVTGAARGVWVAAILAGPWNVFAVLPVAVALVVSADAIWIGVALAGTLILLLPNYRTVFREVYRPNAV